MANEVVRTIIDRAVNYGRVTMMDTLGNYIRMAIMSLSLVILGLFMLFFVPAIPLIVAGLVVAIGAVLTIYYIIQIIRKSVPILRKSDARISLRSFINMHFPVIISGLILVLMLSTFLSATTFSAWLRRWTSPIQGSVFPGRICFQGRCSSCLQGF